MLPCYLIALKRATGVRLRTLATAAFPPLAAAAITAGLAWLAAAQFDRPVVQLLVGLAVGGTLYMALALPQLILLAGPELAARPQVRRLLRGYYKLGRVTGIPIARLPDQWLEL